MNILQLIREDLRHLKPYSAAEQIADTIRLNANEAPWSHPADECQRPLNRYPELRPHRLRSLLADWFDCLAEELLVTRGSSEAIDLLLRATCRWGQDTIVTSSPAFSMVAHYATLQGAKLELVPSSPADDFAVDIRALTAALTPSTKLVYVCSPNNPTGGSMTAADLRDLLKTVGDQALVVVDEAYVEFSSQGSLSHLRADFPLLVILRTLSKACASAGTRCGGIIGPPPLIDLLAAIQPPYALATPVVEVLERILGPAAKPASQAGIIETVRERGRVAAALSNLSFVLRVLPSEANFLFVQFTDAEGIRKHLIQRGILVRGFSGDLGDYLRISIGAAAENDALLTALQQRPLELIL